MKNIPIKLVQERIQVLQAEVERLEGVDGWALRPMLVDRTYEIRGAIKELKSLLVVE
jgi:hypothetical protein